MTQVALKKRRIMLTVGIFSMLFAGIIYAWSILKAPLGDELKIAGPALALCFTLTMCFFCLGGLLGSFISRKIGTRWSVIGAGVIAGLGLVLCGLLVQRNALLLYLTYSIMAGGGIGIVYNIIISSVNAWFPDKKGVCSGVLMMGFGASTLILGNLASALFDSSVGWRMTYVILGIALGVTITVSGLIIKRPGEGDILPEPKAKAQGRNDEVIELSPLQMIRRPSFILAFILLVCLTAVGSSVISFARDLAISVGAGGGLATTLVGLLSVCNGIGRIITGRAFDLLGRKRTMLLATIITTAAAGIILLSVFLASLPLCIVGLCLTGVSYGSSPTVSSAFTSEFYGTKHFPTNFSIMNCNLLVASFVATASSALLSSSGGYVVPFIMLLGLSVVTIVINFLIKKP